MTLPEWMSVDQDRALADLNGLAGQANNTLHPQLGAVVDNNDIAAAWRRLAVSLFINDQQIARMECRLHAISKHDNKLKAHSQQPNRAQQPNRRRKPGPTPQPRLAWSALGHLHSVKP
jgi:hypothetical protein